MSMLIVIHKSAGGSSRFAGGNSRFTEGNPGFTEGYSGFAEDYSGFTEGNSGFAECFIALGEWAKGKTCRLLGAGDRSYRSLKGRKYFSKVYVSRR